MSDLTRSEVMAEEIINLFLDADSLSGEVEIVRESATPRIASIVDRYMSGLIKAPKEAAIKAHIGFKHGGPWKLCGWIECEDRRKILLGAENPDAHS